MAKTVATTTPTVPAIVHEVAKSATPTDLVKNLIALCTFGTPYKWTSTSWASEVPTKNGTKKYSFNDLYRQISERNGFASEDTDPVKVTTKLAADGVIVSRWFGKRHAICVADPNYVKKGSSQAVANDF